MKKERPIIFNTEMVRAIMEGRKTETRRVVKPQPDYINNYMPYIVPSGYDYVNGTYTTGTPWALKCPYGKPGDILYVRERFTIGHDEYIFKTGDESDDFFKWKPSIHMPKKAARIWLQIQDRWVERLQDISEGSCYNEGIQVAAPIINFMNLWQSIHGPGSWEQNPYVWVIKFKLLSTNGKPV